MNSLRQGRVAELVYLQKKTPDHPYSIIHRLALAIAYRDLGYPDLAAGDAYKALLLIDEVSEETEYHEEAVDAAKIDFSTITGSSSASESELVSWVKSDCSKRAYDVLVGSLLDCGCLRSAYDYIQRATKAFPQDLSFAKFYEILSQKVIAHSNQNGEDINDLSADDYPNKNFVRRENYPWNDHEPDRYSVECLEYLAKELDTIAPKLEVKISDLPVLSSSTDTRSNEAEIKMVKQLGLFAKEDIRPGEQVLGEKSLLTAISRLHDTYCDACSVLLPDSRDASLEGDSNILVSCEECDEVFFCSTDCHDLAQDNYHPALCGVSLNQEKVPAREAADNLYTLLLIRALALAETRDVHPLDLKEVRYIWGDYHGSDLDAQWRTDAEGHLSDPFSSVPRTLQFSFTNNVLTPLHILEKMDVNIFTQSYRYDTWVFNTLFAKFRGTASAQQGLDGRPEIGAVHPMWCLANHSCDPNVAWKWEGSMRFWTREHLVDWKGRDSRKQPGLLKGEEVFSHYCDVTLPVKERREWAIGALGGECMCPRCVWEADQEGSDAPVAQ